MNKAVIAGGSGFLGRLLIPAMVERGWDVVVLSRGEVAPAGARVVAWDGRSPGAWQLELEDADLLLNLAGRSVNCRYTSKNQRVIRDSRVDSTRILGAAVAGCRRPPPVWVNASSATIYRHVEDRPMGESDGELGEGFSVDICRAWEAALAEAETPRTRKVALRTAMVLGPGRGGVLDMMARLVRLGLGGTMGPGTQFMSWLHHRDLFEIIEWIRLHDELSGAVNASAPQPMPNREFMKILRGVLRCPVGLPAARWMLEVGAVFLRTETELILKSRRVVPERLLESGYRFRFPRVREAMEEIL